MRIIANIKSTAGYVEEQDIVKNEWMDTVNEVYNENKEENLNERVRKHITDRPSVKDKEKS